MIALVTGATAGIGEATALILAKNGYDLIIIGRRLPKLLDVKKKIEVEYKVEVEAIELDVRKKEDVASCISNLPEKWKQIDVLVNNAGLAAGLDLLKEGKIDNWEKMIDTNVKGLLYVSRAIIPIMVERKKGHIINISSIAGKEVYPRGNVYCATKHSVEALTKAMRMELVRYGVKVTSIAPGMVETEFSIVRLGDKEKADAVYKGFEPLVAKDIAETVEFVVNRPPHVNINDILIMPSAQATGTIVHKEN